jgi:hypothetical protein
MPHPPLRPDERGSASKRPSRRALPFAGEVGITKAAQPFKTALLTGALDPPERWQNARFVRPSIPFARRPTNLNGRLPEWADDKRLLLPSRKRIILLARPRGGRDVTHE